MTAVVFDFKYIAARLARRDPNVPACTGCNDRGWEQAPYNPYAPTLVVYRECTVCHNSKGRASP